MKDRGAALIGIGMSDGDNKAEEAAKRAISSPLLDVSIAGAKDAIVNVTGGPNITLYDANTALAAIREAVGNEVNTILGVAINDQLDDQIIVTIIATGFEDEEEPEMPQTSYTAKATSKITSTFDEPDDDMDEDVPAFLKNRRI
jgi:cell division protein FtsZ